MKVLITGGCGFIGSHLADAFLERGDEVSVLDMASDSKVRHNLSHPRFQLIKDSIFNDEILDTLVRKCDIVYHLAAIVGVEHYVEDPYAVLNVNINGVQNVLRTAYKYEKKVIFSSTSEIYGKNPSVPFKETDDRVLGATSIDRWCYSTSKAAGEHFLYAYGKMGLPFVILRYFNIYGPRLDRIDVGRVITIFLGQVLRQRPITVVGDGSQTRCFTYISDAIRATQAAGLKDEAIGKAINIGNDKETPIKELAETMNRIAGNPSEIVFVKQEDIYGPSYEDVPRRVPDITRMKQLLGVTPEVTTEEGLTKTYEWFKEQAEQS